MTATVMTTSLELDSIEVRSAERVLVSVPRCVRCPADPSRSSVRAGPASPSLPTR